MAPAVRAATLACATGAGVVLLQAAGVTHASAAVTPADNKGPNLLEIAQPGQGTPPGHGGLLGLFGPGSSDGAGAGGDGTLLNLAQGDHRTGPGSGGDGTPVGIGGGKTEATSVTTAGHGV